MTLDVQLENYLNRLDRALSAIAVSERAEIITEIKSHILEAQQRSPERSLGSILDSFGEPETVANRYIMERGLKPTPPPKSPVIKWLMIGLLGTFGMFCATALIIIFKFSPLIEVNEKEGKVRILGGLIKVDENMAGDLRIDADIDVNDGSSQQVSGEHKVDLKKSRLAIPFGNAKIDVETAADDRLLWSCKIIKGASGEIFTANQNNFTLDLKKSGGAKCHVRIPAGVATEINGANGKIHMIRPRFDTTVKVMNGKVSLVPDTTQPYEFDTSVVNGKADAFPVLSKAGARPWKIVISVMNGIISRDAD